MKKPKIHTPKVKTTLPRHEQAARRTRAKAAALPAIPRKRPPTAAPNPRAASASTHSSSANSQ
jgi:hypothetical protein